MLRIDYVDQWEIKSVDQFKMFMFLIMSQSLLRFRELEMYKMSIIRVVQIKYRSNTHIRQPFRIVILSYVQVCDVHSVCNPRKAPSVRSKCIHRAPSDLQRLKQCPVGFQAAIRWYTMKKKFGLAQETMLLHTILFSKESILCGIPQSFYNETLWSTYTLVCLHSGICCSLL